MTLCENIIDSVDIEPLAKYFAEWMQMRWKMFGTWHWVIPPHYSYLQKYC